LPSRAASRILSSKSLFRIDVDSGAPFGSGSAAGKGAQRRLVRPERFGMLRRWKNAGATSAQTGGTDMAGKADFSEQEWEALQKGVTGAGLLVAVSDRGFFDTFKEAGALAKHLAGARRDSTSEIVRELAETRGTGFGLGSPGKVEGETLDALRSSVSTLEAKAPDEVEAYKSFVLEVAQSVASAAEGGDVGESGALEKIRSALGGATPA